MTSYRPRATSSTPVAATVLARLFSAFASVTSAASSLCHNVKVNPIPSSRSMKKYGARVARQTGNERLDVLAHMFGPPLQCLR